VRNKKHYGTIANSIVISQFLSFI